MRQRTRRHGAAVLAALLPIVCALGGCMVGPDYRRPPAIISGHFKELAGWKPSAPSDTVDRGAWWSIYRDPVLDRLERQVATSNQSLRAQVAAFQATVAVVAEARSQLFPTVGATASVTRSAGGGGGGRGGTTTLTSPSLGGVNTGTGIGTGTNTLTTTSTTAGTGTSGRSFGGSTFTSYDLSGTVDWELDLWGRIRRQVESDVAAAQASAADIANVRLSNEALLATDYFELRASDSLNILLNDTVRDYRQALQITLNQYNAGVAARGDVITAQTQLQSAITSFINVGVLRSQLEHAIAVLIGRPPADLTIPPERLPLRVPVVPPGVPSELLERRPDIAVAERTMSEENALIGVAVAAYYPQVTLSALYGYVGNPLSSLIQAANRIWSLGAAASESLFEGGARTAAVAAARATYDEAVANYRQTVLVAFQGVEDQLAALRIYADQARAEDEAVALARRAVQIALNEYRAGTQPYTTVITAQNTLLVDEEAALTIQQDRLVASVTLVEDLGGGWTAARLPSKASLQTFNPLLPGSRIPYTGTSETK
ncbi:MAG: efflux transporter outer membrane subunit [Acetobacteraceae bacterium]|nr:efflux transporter outer membrane subunit [Acetobacteraceae bacterium]